MTVKRDIDKRRLREAFFQTYDEGRAMDLLGKLAAGRQCAGLSLIGEGMHFRCWRESKAKGPIDLVLKIAKEDFLSEVGNLAIWRTALANMPIGIDLMPPTALLPVKLGKVDSVGMVMPFGPDLEDKCSTWWQPIRDRLTTFKEGAGLNGLVLGDIPQIRCWEGIPFMIDISDLRSR
jgi:hypothetical protein